jgi:hypothetical protein
MIDADEQVFIDIGELIRDQVPDKNGNILPATVASGAYSLKVISSPLHVALYEGKVITDKTYGHATYGCMICCGYGGPAFVYDPTSTIVNGTGSVGVYGNDLCAGFSTAIDSYFSTWYSTNNAIFTMSTNQVHGVSVDSAGMGAHATSLPTGDGQAATHNGSGVSSCPVLQSTALGTGNTLTQTPIQHSYPRGPFSRQCWISSYFDATRLTGAHHADDAIFDNGSGTGSSILHSRAHSARKDCRR